MISIEIKEESDEQWNDRLFESNLATIYQTKEWGSLLNDIGRKPLFAKFIDNKGNIVGQNLIPIISNLDKKGLIGKFLKKTFSKHFSIYNWSYGPIVFRNDLYQDIMNSLIVFLKSQKCKVSGIGHPLLSNDISFLDNKMKKTEWITYLIDLNYPIDELYNAIEKHSGRKNIERSIKRGVEIEEITLKSLSDYVNLMNIGKDEKEKLDLERMRKVWTTLKPLGYSGFLARKDNVPIGGLMFSYLNGQIIEAGVVRSEIDRKNNLYSQDLIKWKIIEWGVKNKMKYYNLAGANPNPKSSKEEGILRYKKKWGGKKYTYWILNRGINER